MILHKSSAIQGNQHEMLSHSSITWKLTNERAMPR